MGCKNSTLIKSSVEEGMKIPIADSNAAKAAPAVEKVAFEGEDFLPAASKSFEDEGEEFLPAPPARKVGFAAPDSPEPERRQIKRNNSFTESVKKSMMGKSIIQTALDAFDGGETMTEESARKYDYAESHKKWKDVFLECDDDNNGFVDVIELQSALESVLEQEVTFEQAQSVMNDFSKQKPGLLDISEFVIMLTFVYESVQKSNLRATTRLGGLSSQLEIAAQEAEQDRDDMLEEIASKVYPFRDILHIQDYEANETTIDKNVSAHQDHDFSAAFAPSEMRCLALVSHNGMKATMKKFVLANKNILKKFRLTGTNSTMTMLREVFKDEADQIVFGPSCKSGPLGGDAELVALMCSGGLGGMLFFQDPMDAHPHQADIDCLVRQALVHNTMMANTPVSALMMMNVFRNALEGVGKPELIPSFFFTLESPSVAAYKAGQNKVIASHSK
ncbi:hypothetical protein CTEN210_01319 [Chaetoceros tenuissimus]|uniref:EF-hand domain-containing protein n=1 Tax=Chaetoceros tenuissimus TaxID=426638 RepID=A0AAD3CGS4_9STRA|nr:hypothetical protein CTEN210_01319 [Chaetoceros tenuissimus]